jgi:hypothetical protein
MRGASYALEGCLSGLSACKNRSVWNWLRRAFASSPSRERSEVDLGKILARRNATTARLRK